MIVLALVLGKQHIPQAIHHALGLSAWPHMLLLRAAQRKQRSGSTPQQQLLLVSETAQRRTAGLVRGWMSDL